MPHENKLRIRPGVQKRLHQIGQEFLADFLTRKARRAPDSVEVLVTLARVLTDLGRLEEGLSVDEKLVSLIPRNPIVHYNLGCSQALLGRTDEALDSLRQAIRLGYTDLDYMRRDADLESLREEPGFEALIEELRRS